jgi:hypothetical protein
MTEVIEPENLQEIKFYLHKITFIPYSDTRHKNSVDILVELMTFLNREHVAGKAYFIDRNKNQPKAERREMFMYNPVLLLREKRIKCSIALVRDKNLMLKPKDSFELIPFSKAEGSIAEVTHFFADYSVNPPVLCVEFNNNGPRISDIEFYLRNLAQEIRNAKGCQTTTYMDIPIDKTLENLKNVLNFEIKLRPANIAQMDNEIKGYIVEFANLHNRLKPNFIRIEASFQTPGVKVKSEHLNKEANNMFKALLRKFQEDDFHIDQFDEFEFKFVNKEGQDETFNLIKGKREIVVKIDRSAHTTTTKYYELIKPKFNSFIQTFKR